MTAKEYLKKLGVLKDTHEKWIVQYDNHNAIDIIILMQDYAKLKCKEQRTRNINGFKNNTKV